MARTLVLMLSIFIFLLLRGNCAFDCGVGQYQQDEGCRECRSTCAKCISEFFCTECKAGYFGDSCTKTCSEGCHEKLCVQETGACLACDNGYYLKEICETCPENCRECINADHCTICKTGYTGRICQKECINCKPDSMCSLFEGICSDGCKDGYSGLTCFEHCSSNCLSCDRIHAKQCIACANGKYGRNCEKACPTNCIDKICSKDTGTCIYGCQNGFWGDQCGYVCPVNCHGGKCLRSNGGCTDGCSGNFTGIKCLCPSTCECDADGACTKCAKNTDYVCDKQCSSICIYNMCSLKTPRKCFYGCRDGYDGSLCSPHISVKDDEPICRVEKISLVVLSALFFIMTGTVICLLYQRRKTTGAIRMNGNQQTERQPIDELSGTYSEAYVQNSEQYGVTSPSSAVGESTYITPVNTGVNPRNQYETMESEYVPLSAADSSENQYRQPTKEIST